MPRCLIIAGPNGAGKTTFARTFLPRQDVRRFINADLLAAGLSPLDPAAAQLAAGRLFLSELDRLSAARENFAFESTLSGLGYLTRLRRWRRAGTESKLYTSSFQMCGWLWNESRPVCAPAVMTSRRLMCAAALSVAGPILRCVISS